MKSGIILLHKQADMTSFDCIRALKRTLDRTDLGHGGTLDKFATGLLPVLVGEGLKLARFFLESYPTLSTYWKTYTGRFELGTATDTCDPTGEVVKTAEVPLLDKTQVQAAMSSFVRVTYEQMPPRFSAKKVGGERASDLVRSGHEPELKAVPVTIKRFECKSIDEKTVEFEVECSKGTYIRSLAEDLAKKLNTVAHVKTLCRGAVGNFSLANALELDSIDDGSIQGMEFATSFLGSFQVRQEEVAQLAVGKTIDIGLRLANSGFSAGVYCATDSSNQPLALFELSTEKRVNFIRAFQFRI